MLLDFQIERRFRAGTAAAWLLLCTTAACTTPAASTGETDARLEMAAMLAPEANGIVAVAPASLIPESPDLPVSSMQNYVVRGAVTECLKGRFAPGEAITYRTTAETPPRTLAAPHIALLRRSDRTGEWVQVEGPSFPDTPALRTGLRQLTGGCPQ